MFAIMNLMFTVVGRDRLLHCNCLLSVCNLSTCYRRIDVWFQQRFMSLYTIKVNPHVHINKRHSYVIVTHVERILDKPPVWGKTETLLI